MSEDPAKYEPFPARGPSAADKAQIERELEDAARIKRISLGAHDPRQIRIEALRAAATVMAPENSPSRGQYSVGKATVDMARQFAAWLETGE